MATLVSCDQLNVFCSKIKDLPDITGDQLFEDKGPSLQRINARGGVIVYHIQDGQIYICLGRSEQNDWTDLAGGCDPGEKIIDCCLREFEQESNGIFGKYDLEDFQEEYFLQYNSYICLFLPLHAHLNPQDVINNFKPPDGERIEIFELKWFSFQDILGSIQRRNDISIYLCLRVILISKLNAWIKLITDRK